VFFDTDQAILRPDAIATLQAILGELQNTGPDAPISVEGHTDYRNTNEYN
jgi:outer membrane protein OmpA-like peptidoglycan-associated protein